MCKHPYFHPEQKLFFPCGQCLSCRITKRRKWVTRMILESRDYGDKQSFITLTYSPENDALFTAYMDIQQDVEQEEFTLPLEQDIVEFLEDRIKTLENAIESHAKILARFQMTEGKEQPLILTKEMEINNA